MGNGGANRKDSLPGIGLTLGGGIVHTVAAVGVFRVLEEAGIRVGAVSGTSGGALVGAAIAAGKPAAEIDRMARNLRWRHLVRFHPRRIGVLDGAPIARFIEGITGCSRIEELKIPFTAVATDISTGEEVRLKSGSLGAAVQASCSLPGLFQPVEREGRLLIDGGITDNVPVEAVREYSPQVVVAVDVLQFLEGHRESLRLGLQLLLKSYQIMVKLISSRQERRADMVVMPNTAGCSFTNFRNAGRLIERGEEAMRALLPRLRAVVAEHRDGGPPVAWES